MSFPAPWATITAAVRPAANPCGTTSTPETLSSADTGMVTSRDLMLKTDNLLNGQVQYDKNLCRKNMVDFQELSPREFCSRRLG